jgi:SAM-dependent methyltransferase
VEPEEPPLPKELGTFVAIQEMLSRRLLDREPKRLLPGLRFPDAPTGPLGSALSKEFGHREWTAMLKRVRLPRHGRMLDFGCGTADRRALAKRRRLRWFGLDVPYSIEWAARSDRSNVTLYQGVQVPFADGVFDLIVSVQVFEHVPEPATTLAELSRILRSGGYLVGSTSFNEPFHSESTFGYTPKHFAHMLDEVGFDPIEITPGIDMWTITMRRLARQFRQEAAADFVAPFFTTAASPLNQIIDEYAQIQEIEAVRANALKLELAGQFNFLARKR